MTPSPIPTQPSALLPCPFCGEVPPLTAIQSDENQGGKWGRVVCCISGPEVRTGYKTVEFWQDAAIEAWNTRAKPPSIAGTSAEDAVRALVAKWQFDRNNEIDNLDSRTDQSWFRGYNSALWQCANDLNAALTAAQSRAQGGVE